MQGVVVDIKSVLNPLEGALESEYEGSASTEFISLWRENYLPVFDKTNESYDGLHQEMKDVADVMEQAGADIAGGFGRVLS